MRRIVFPTIDPVETGKNIALLRRERGLSVHDLQEYFGFDAPQAIYKWQKGSTLPSVDNLYALSALLDVPMESILVPNGSSVNRQQSDGCCLPVYDYVQPQCSADIIGFIADSHICVPIGIQTILPLAEGMSVA